jgi:hypothetical protein
MWVDQEFWHGTVSLRLELTRAGSKEELYPDVVDEGLREGGGVPSRTAEI